MHNYKATNVFKFNEQLQVTNSDSKHVHVQIVNGTDMGQQAYELNTVCYRKMKP